MKIAGTIAGQAVPHESAREHVTGEALYTDDLLLRFPRPLHAWPVLAPHAHALVKALDFSAALSEPGVTTVLATFLVKAIRDPAGTTNRFFQTR